MKQFAGIWRKLLGYIRPYLPAVTLGLICAVFSTILTLLGPDRFSELSNLILVGITDQPDLQAIREVALTLVLYYGAGSVLHMMQNWIMTTTTQRISGRLRRDISTKINRLPMWFYNRMGVLVFSHCVEKRYHQRKARKEQVMLFNSVIP